MTKPPPFTLVEDVSAEDQFTIEQRVAKIEQRLETMTKALAAITRVLETIMTGKKVHEDAERSG